MGQQVAVNVQCDREKQYSYEISNLTGISILYLTYTLCRHLAGHI